MPHYFNIVNFFQDITLFLYLGLCFYLTNSVILKVTSFAFTSNISKFFITIIFLLLVSNIILYFSEYIHYASSKHLFSPDLLGQLCLGCVCSFIFSVYCTYASSTL